MRLRAKVGRFLFFLFLKGRNVTCGVRFFFLGCSPDIRLQTLVSGVKQQLKESCELR